MRRAIVGVLALLAFVGATSYVGWLQGMWETRFVHLGKAASEDIRLWNDPFSVLRKAVDKLDPAAHPSDAAHVILAYDGADLQTPTRIETFYTLYPMVPRLMDMHDPSFRTAALALPSGGFVVSDPDILLPTRQFEKRDAHGFFMYVRR